MTKLAQLRQFRAWCLPTPPFVALTYDEFRAGRQGAGGMRFPLAVRSTYADEDGAAASRAGHFRTRLRVGEEELPLAVADVFDSYPDPRGQSVILQEMLEPDYSGVLFAFRSGVWKAELDAGTGEAVVGGRRRPLSLLLPRFDGLDGRVAGLWPFWAGLPGRPPSLTRALIRLSVYAGLLLRRMEAPAGLDIEFAVVGSRLYLLQARPITTPDEAESVLTAANHKEILPPRPSRLMTSVIAGAGEELFGFYRRMDPSLPSRPFIEAAAGMPWISLSALLDTMVHWGLPTRLVCDSVGAEDCYRVGLRPWRVLRKLPVFLRLALRQSGAVRGVRRWLAGLEQRRAARRRRRTALWPRRPEEAFRDWHGDFRQCYVELVTHMQLLTGATAGPVSLLNRMGLLTRLTDQLARTSASTDYFRAFRDWQQGRLSHEAFLERFGHRGFYESDIGQPRFGDFGADEWRQLARADDHTPAPAAARAGGSAGWLLAPVARLIHAREHLRHETMRAFWSFRRELADAARDAFGPDLIPWDHAPEELAARFAGAPAAEEPHEPPAGWDMNAFLCNRLGRRLPLSVLDNVAAAPASRQGIGIYPGRVRGQVWRVESAGLDHLRRPPFPRVILVADALDPGWIPFFARVDGVLSYTGGLLSHASIILRESRLPAITQLPPHLGDLHTGDWIEMDGSSGEVWRVGELTN